MIRTNICSLRSKRDICDGFKQTFQDSFVDSWTGHANGDAIMNDAFQKVFTRIFGCTITEVSLDDVYYSIGQLKCGKAAGVDRLSAECVKFAHPRVALILCNLFNLCLKHSFVPENFCSGRIVPIPKKPSECSTFGDFRLVISIKILVKIFEYCLLSKLENYFVIHDLQFGFIVGGCL